MSVSVHIKGIIPADAAYRTALSAWKACEAAGVDPPQELYQKLGLDPDDGEEPNPDGAEVDIPMVGEVEYNDGAVVELTSLPKSVTKLRIYMQ